MVPAAARAWMAPAKPAPEQECIWNVVYRGALAMGDDPQKFARTLIPPRDWRLDGTNALANRFVGIDNLAKRKAVGG